MSAQTLGRQFGLWPGLFLKSLDSPGRLMKISHPSEFPVTPPLQKDDAKENIQGVEEGQEALQTGDIYKAKLGVLFKCFFHVQENNSTSFIYIPCQLSSPLTPHYSLPKIFSQWPSIISFVKWSIKNYHKHHFPLLALFEIFQKYLDEGMVWRDTKTLHFVLDLWDPLLSQCY